MKKLLTITSAAVLAVAVGSAFAAPAKLVGKATQPTFLFAMYAKHAAVKEVNGDIYSLVIDKSNVEDITAL